MNEKLNKVLKNENSNILKEDKHYNRFRQFITYDIEDRAIEEKVEILNSVQQVIIDMLNELENESNEPPK